MTTYLILEPPSPFIEAICAAPEAFGLRICPIWIPRQFVIPSLPSNRPRRLFSVCDCVAESYLINVVMTPHLFYDGFRFCHVWIGPCPNCRRTFWMITHGR